MFVRTGGEIVQIGLCLRVTVEPCWHQMAGCIATSKQQPSELKIEAHMEVLKTEIHLAAFWGWLQKQVNPHRRQC